MKKGISLIVLVITIIVMIIIAGAIIISLNSTSVIEKANAAVTATDVGTLNDKLVLAYADLKATYPTVSTFGDSDEVKVGNETYDNVEDYYDSVLADDTIPQGYYLDVRDNGSAMIVETRPE